MKEVNMKKILRKRVLEKKIFAVLLALSLMVGTLAAGGVVTENEVKAASEETEVHLRETQVTLYMEDEDEDVEIELLGTDDEESNISWEIKNSKIAEISSDFNYCTIYPVSEGNTVITAKYRGEEYTCKVTVKKYSPKSIKQWNKLLTACKKNKVSDVLAMVDGRDCFFWESFYNNYSEKVFSYNKKKQYLIYYTNEKKTKGIAIYEQDWKEVINLQVYYGDLKNGIPNGKGKFFGNVSTQDANYQMVILQGNVKDGYMSGKVKMNTYDDWGEPGRVYTGNMKKGLWNGNISIKVYDYGKKKYIWHFKAKCKNGKWQKHKKKPGKLWTQLLGYFGYKAKDFQKYLGTRIPCTEADLKKYKKGKTIWYYVLYVDANNLGTYAKGYR